MPAVGRGPILIFVVCAVLAIAGCGSGDDSSSATPAKSVPASSVKPSKAVEKAGITLLRPGIPKHAGSPPEQLVSTEVIPGVGATAGDGDEVTVNYVGAGYETGKEFGASWDNKEPLTFTLGDEQVIPGWDEGIVGMKENSRRELIVPLDLADSSAGSPPNIPPGEALVFLIDLLAIN